MKYPEDIRALLTRRYKNNHGHWLTADHGSQDWPLEVSLGIPSEQAALKHPEVVRAWINAWEVWHGVGDLQWCERRWRTLGTQRLPQKLVIYKAQDLAIWSGDFERWNCAKERYAKFITRWPTLAPCLPQYFDILADYSTVDFERVGALLDWFEVNPNSNLYPRQLPIPGVDSKWIENRKSMITDLIAKLNGTSNSRDFYEHCGLKKMPQVIRLRVLDPLLRKYLGGLEDITAPIENIAALDLPISTVYIVENLQTGLAFGDISGAVLFMRLGYNVDVLNKINWLNRASCYYWGDIDTHGFAILNRARSYHPHIKSILMDENTLLIHKGLWGTEQEQHSALVLSTLTEEEQKVYTGSTLKLGVIH